MRRRETDNRTTFQTLALITQIGLTMIVSIGLACALGVWLDRKFGTSWMTIVLFFMGAVAGGQSAYRMIRKICEPRNGDKERDWTGEDSQKDKIR